MTSASLHVRPESFANKSTWVHGVAAASRAMASRASDLPDVRKLIGARRHQVLQQQEGALR
jgi:hypothetical protein